MRNLSSILRSTVLAPAIGVALIGSMPARAAEAAAADAPVATKKTLKGAYQGAFYIGVAVNAAQYEGRDEKGDALIAREFNSVTPENALKWDATEPQNGTFRFEQADRFVKFGEENHMFIVGHNLCWHSQLPGWVSKPDAGQATLTKEVLLERLRRHIFTVAGRYKGRIGGWDVVNEAIDDSGGYRNNVFYRVIGKEYLALAFKWAHEADPQAELYYNDYNLEQSEAKRARAVEIVKYLREQGARIDGVGLQGHVNLTYPSDENIDAAIRAFAQLGTKVMITELDVQAVSNAGISGAVEAFKSGQRRVKGLTPEQQQALANRYRDLFKVFWKYRDTITRVTIWGLRDADSWRRASSPVLFDNNYEAKSAFDAVVAVPTGKQP